jgi:sensor c-di-GMP phosphodiesterase-like protein
MSTLNRRLGGMVGIMLLTCACGALAGYCWGREFTLRQMTDTLDQHAQRIRADGDISSAEARAVLAAMNGSAYPYCSDVEIAHFRKLIYESQYLKDAARTRNGRIDCTATLGRVSGTDAELGQGVQRADGTQFFRDIGIFRIPGLTVVAVEKGDALIVYNPYNRKELQSSWMHITVTNRGGDNGQTRLLGELPQTKNAILTNEGTARIDDTLYATRCSERYSSCVSAYISVNEALRSESGQLTAYAVLCGLCGALLGFALWSGYRRRQSLEQRLRRAIRRNAIRVSYQPVVSLHTGRIVGAEALARWTDAAHGEVSPEIFIRVAEERGFVGEITRHVIQSALADVKSILSMCPDFQLSVNIAPQDLGDEKFLPMLEESLRKTGVSARCLVIEITERAAADSQTARDSIARLRSKGHSVHIDDFGTGYSSLAYLHGLSVNGLKIDKAFTQAVGTESVPVLVLPQIFSLAASLGLQVTVEGIETEEQLRYFSANPLPMLGQGWFLGRPMSIEMFLRVFEEQERAAAEPAVSM